MKIKLFTLTFIILSLTFVKAQSSDKEIKFGGRIMYDMAIWETTVGNEVTEMAGTEFRRVRLYNSGKLYGNLKYKLQLDFAGGKISYRDVWIELGGLPLHGSLRVGHFKEPLRLEALTSSKYITFMERALPIAFSPERNTGAMYQSSIDDRIEIQAGIFREADSFGNDKEATNNVNMTGRITYLAMNSNNRLLHLGAAMSKRKNSEHNYGFSVRPENHLGTKLLNPSFSDVDETNITGIEMAYVNGRFSIQGEYVMTTVSAETEYELNGYYGQISYFLTGESRLYKNSYIGFNRVKPKSNFGANGKGAIELAARISKMDLSKANLGTLDDMTVGVNWYLNPYTRVMLNYVIGDLIEGDGKGEVSTTENSMQCRIQIDF